jgi:hypothetical protein
MIAPHSSGTGVFLFMQSYISFAQAKAAFIIVDLYADCCGCGSQCRSNISGRAAWMKKRGTSDRSSAVRSPPYRHGANGGNAGSRRRRRKHDHNVACDAGHVYINDGCASIAITLPCVSAVCDRQVADICRRSLYAVLQRSARSCSGVAILQTDSTG